MSMKLLRFTDLKELGIVNNRMTLARWQKSQGFPAGIRLAQNSVAFREADVIAWLAARTGGKAPESSQAA